MYRYGNRSSINVPLLLRFYFCTNNKLVAMTQDIQCTAGLSCVAVIMTENTHNRHCNMHCNSDCITLFDITLTAKYFDSYIRLKLRQ